MQMVLRLLLAEPLRFPFLDGDSPLRAFAEASAQAIAILIADKPSFAINNLQCSLGAGRDTSATAVAFTLVYFDYLSQNSGRHFAPPDV
jgi:hypothetical protein